MAYLDIASGAYPLSSADVRAAHPNTSFPATAAEFEASLPEFGYAVVQPVTQPQVNYTKNVIEGTPQKVGTIYKQVWQISDATATEISDRTSAESKSVRQERNNRLSLCDWTQLSDSPGSTRAAYVQYRQALRDVPSQSGFPWTITWPEEP